MLAVFDETLQKEALVRLTERETDLVKDGFIEKEMTTVILRAGVKEVTWILNYVSTAFTSSNLFIFSV